MVEDIPNTQSQTHKKVTCHKWKNKDEIAEKELNEMEVTKIPDAGFKTGYKDVQKSGEWMVSVRT